MNVKKRYGNGNTPDQQKAADNRYRHKQRIMRTWVDDVAEGLGVTRDELISSPAALVAELLMNTKELSCEKQSNREN